MMFGLRDGPHRRKVTECFEPTVSPELHDRHAGCATICRAATAGTSCSSFRKPSVIAAACEDYRGGASVDLELDRQDRAAGRRIGCPTLVLWATRFLQTKGGSPLVVWRRWASDVHEVALDCGHFVAEEEPDSPDLRRNGRLLRSPLKPLL
jgi:haloacetate dehalogenase